MAVYEDIWNDERSVPSGYTTKAQKLILRVLLRIQTWIWECRSAQLLKGFTPDTTEAESTTPLPVPTEESEGMDTEGFTVVSKKRIVRKWALSTSSGEKELLIKEKNKSNKGKKPHNQDQHLARNH